MADIGRLAARLFSSDLEVAVGSGILVGEQHVLTCAHVVNAALNRDEDCTELPEGEVVIFLDFPTGEQNSVVQSATVIKNTWRPTNNDAKTRKLEDAVLLKLDSCVDFDGDANPWSDWENAEYLNNPFKAIGFSNEGGIWIDGECQGGNDRGWIQLDSDKHDITTGCSGGPVFDKQSHSLIGMLVAEYQEGKQRIAYLIPTRRLKEILPPTLFFSKETPKHYLKKSNTNLAKLLAKMLDRVELVKSIEKTLNKCEKKRHHCFMFDCIHDDKPECFARHLQLKPHLKDYHSNTGMKDKLKFTDLSTGSAEECFEQKLLEKVGDIQNWLATGRSNLVVYTSINLENGIGAHVNTISAFLAKIEKMCPEKKQVIVLIGCYREDVGFMGRFQQKKELKKIEHCGVVLLEPLKEINSGDLSNWFKELPNNISEQFDDDKLHTGRPYASAP